MAENGLVINNGATAGTRPPKSFGLYVMGWNAGSTEKYMSLVPGLLFLLACEVMETCSGLWPSRRSMYSGGLLERTCSWDEKQQQQQLLGLCNVDTALSEIGSSKDVLTLHGISNPSDSLCAPLQVPPG